jgi:2'-hydroxyisoflavone reductase
VQLLVLGGTVFLGRHLVEAALARGHEVTIFTRGRHGAHLYGNTVERLTGDREGDLDALRGRAWDAVVDTSGHRPRTVRASAELLAASVASYAFVSSISVYAGFPVVAALDESAPVGQIADPDAARPGPATMGPLKALCERAVADAVPGRALIVRSGLLAGPHDPTDRFPYWPHRIADGGEVLAPGGPELRVQLIDARDLAAWILDGLEAGRAGVYNATGPAEPLTMAELLECCRAVTGGDARLTWVDDAFVLDRLEEPIVALPLWVPGASRGAGAIDCRRAIGAGLTFRPLAETVRDTFAWDVRRPPPKTRRAGLTRAREAELLDAYRALHAASPV